MREKQLFRHQGVGGGAPEVTVEIPLQPVVRTMVRQTVPLQLMEIPGEEDTHLQPIEDLTPEQVEARRIL